MVSTEVAMLFVYTDEMGELRNGYLMAVSSFGENKAPAAMRGFFCIQ